MPGIVDIVFYPREVLGRVYIEFVERGSFDHDLIAVEVEGLDIREELTGFELRDTAWYIGGDDEPDFGQKNFRSENGHLQPKAVYLV
jgi:hypothetical protein